MGFLVSFFHRREKNSATAAKDRLLDVLIHDRVKLSPATMEQIRQEILGVLSKYMDVDREAMEVTLIRADGAHQLTAHVPIRRGESFDPMEADDEPEQRPRSTGPAPQTSPAAGTGGAGASPSRRYAPSPPPQQFGPRSKKRH